ncbi:MAG TPA: hypothetical protein P5186_07870 [Candidatus Paceibacterota bacterium]|nr:hypothetical protein [Verrucomicrobiota bacterium]HRY47946.1 hypothetical protein [Candidatus Paceibacterota bacterium]HSA01536.1 hypothetical protein [Candidatus Paceibacterota bacterium]
MKSSRNFPVLAAIRTPEAHRHGVRLSASLGFLASRITIAFLVTGLLSILPGVLVADISLTGLRCEYLSNPTGIDEAQPRLSWRVESTERGQRQTAYRVLVSSSAERLEAGQGDLWDSGKAPSAETVNISYAGKTLMSRQSAWWKVQA